MILLDMIYRIKYTNSGCEMFNRGNKGNSHILPIHQEAFCTCLRISKNLKVSRNSRLEHELEISLTDDLCGVFWTLT